MEDDFKKYGTADIKKMKLVSPIVEKRLLENVGMTKYQVIIALMNDLGLRVTETITLQIKHFDFHQNTVTIYSLKKGKDKNGNKVHKYRTIPLTRKVKMYLTKYWEELPDRKLEAYLFPTNAKKSKKPHISRMQVWRYLKKKSDGNVHPHMFRHTACTRIVRENEDNLRVAQKILGHKSMLTTEIYTHVEQHELVKAMAATEKRNLLQKIKAYCFPVRDIMLTPTDYGMTKYHIGRSAEMKLIADLTAKKVNIFLQGPKGVGKTQLLDSIGGSNILRLDELKNKTTMGGLLIELFSGDKAAIASMLFGAKVEKAVDEETGEEYEVEEMNDYKDVSTKKMVMKALEISKKDLSRVVMKNSIKQMTELAIKVTEKYEYTLIIDDATDITNTGVKILEKLNNHFHIILAARNIKIDKANFLSNFQKIELKPLSRSETIELINLDSKDLYPRIEDYEAYKNHIWESTNGNPLYTLEMIDRYRKERNINLSVTKEIRHTASRTEWDMTIPFMVAVGAGMVLRYYGREASPEDKNAYMLIGTIFMVVLLFFRPLMNLGKRKFA